MMNVSRHIFGYYKYSQYLKFRTKRHRLLIISYFLQCDCGGDLECLNARRRIEACRSDVLYANRLDTVVSCTEAQWIRTADAECGKALEYYNLLCRGMFKGKRCNQRCKNSIQILSRQTKAIKLGKLYLLKFLIAVPLNDSNSVEC